MEYLLNKTKKIAEQAEIFTFTEVLNIVHLK